MKIIQKNPHDFDIEKWKTPRTYCNNFSPIPEKSGVYAVLDIQLLEYAALSIEVLYIGISKNLKQRTKGSAILSKIRKEYADVYIYFQEISHNFREKEKEYIKSFQPKFNIQHKGNRKYE